MESLQSSTTDPRLSNDYCSCFCEENCYKLAQKLVSQGPTHVVVITSRAAATPLWFQKSAAKEPGAAVCWDYHVVVISDGFVYDLDTALTYPCPFDEYSSASFRSSLELPPKHRHLFLIITAEDYLATFSSDRSHMAGVAGIQYPPWPCIRGPLADKTHTLADLISPLNANMVDLQALVRQFSSTQK